MYDNDMINYLIEAEIILYAGEYSHLTQHITMLI